MNRFTVHLDILAPDSEAAWAKADAMAETTDAYAYTVTTADHWARFVKHPQDRP